MAKRIRHGEIFHKGNNLHERKSKSKKVKVRDKSNQPSPQSFKYTFSTQYKSYKKIKICLLKSNNEIHFKTEIFPKSNISTQ